MLTPEEKEKIVERIRLEESLRRDMAKSHQLRTSWVNSKLGLLVIGSVITGVIVPWLQFTQNRFEWQRQNAFEYTQFRLAAARDCLSEFVRQQVYLPQVLERLELLKSGPRLEKEALLEQPKEFMQLRADLSQQSVKVRSLIVHLDEADKIQGLYENHVTIMARALDQAGDAIYQVCRDGASPADPNGTQECIGRACTEIEKNMRTLQGLCTEIVNAVRVEIGRLEDERSRFL